MCPLDNFKNSALNRAAQAGKAPVFAYLLDKRNDPAQRNTSDASCIDIARDCKDPTVLPELQQLLRKRGFNLACLSEGPGDPVDVEVGKASMSSRAAMLKQTEEAESMIEKMYCLRWTLMWLVSVSFVAFQYILDLRAVLWQEWPQIAALFELGVVASLALFYHLFRSDPGKVKPSTDPSTNIEALLRGIRLGKDVPCSRLCTTTWVLKGLRTKYCKETHACIEEFDHYCDFFANPIGRNNHRAFYVICWVEVSTQYLHLLSCFLVARSTIPLSDVFQIFPWGYKVATSYPLMCLTMWLHGFGLPFMLYMLLMQSVGIGYNVTQNEIANWRRYEHLWEPGTGHRKAPIFRNCFCKGSFFRNVLDFWWHGSRRECGPGCPEGIIKIALMLKEAGAK
ncbi:unnamed protein product [Polarella glacialis]|uniref:Palmitoyltransferase n=1 Tax=Polarella glacialis TaxID=89957 RepID=A0A813FBX4_POLGL|nr:unnamed protein product [Polarella glacialis]